MTETIERFKVLTRDGTSAHGGKFAWSLPTRLGDNDNDPQTIPGDWTPPIANPEICERGYHLTTDPMRWPVIGMRVFTAEPDVPEPVEVADDKSLHRSVRLLAERADLVSDYWRMVEHFVTIEIPALPLLKQTRPPDPAWRHFTGTTLAAARDAAINAAGDAVWDAAGIGARDAVGDAVMDAVGIAVGSAVGIAARNAVTGAVWDAAGSAAGFGATDAVWDVVEIAARAAIWDAELYVLVEIVCGDLGLLPEHRQHVRDRWAVWQAGYALLCDVDGVLYTYGVAP